MKMEYNQCMHVPSIKWSLVFVAAFLLFSFIGVLSAKYDEPLSRVSIIYFNKEEGIMRGIYKGKKNILKFIINDNNKTNTRTASFFWNTTKKKNVPGGASYKSTAFNNLYFFADGVEWGKTTDETLESRKLNLTPADERKLKKFGRSETSRAILEIAAYTSLHAEPHDYEYPLTVLEFYYELAPYYSVKNKKLSQPIEPKFPDSCPLLQVCDLVTNVAVYGCRDGVTKEEWSTMTEVEKDLNTIPVMPLLDGLPPDCKQTKE